MKNLLQERSQVERAIQQINHIEEEMVGRVPNKEIYILYLIKKWLGARCKNYLEIGSLNGSSLCLVMSDDSDVETNFFAIDLCKTRMDHFKNKVSPEILHSNIKRFNVNGRPYRIICGNSQFAEIQAEARNAIPDGVDFFFIDGNHSYDGVRKDFYNYIDMINSGGVIVFDDYNFINTVRTGVDSIVKEIGGHEFEIIGTFMNPDYFDEYPIEMKLSQTNMNSEYIIIKR